MSKEYLAWVREQDCALCLKPGPNEAHHIKGMGHYSGVGLKAPDIAIMPLCRHCHALMHNDPGRWVDQWEYLARTVIQGFLDGKIKFASEGEKGRE